MVKISFFEEALCIKVEGLLWRVKWYRRFRNAAILNLVKTVAEIIRKDDLECLFAGGIAYDALRGKIKRLHKDVDIMFLSRHRPAVLSAFRLAGFCLKEKSPYYTVAQTDKGLNVDLFSWVETADGAAEMISDGVLVRIPHEFFWNHQTAFMENMCLKVAGNECLKSSQPFIPSARDRLFVSKLETIPYKSFAPRMETFMRKITLKVLEYDTISEN